MFEQLQTKRWKLSRRVSVCLAVFFALLFGFEAGLLTAVLKAGKRPQDWFGPIFNMLFSAVWMVYAAVQAAKKAD